MTAAIKDVAACVFDAYGTMFDVNAAAARCRDALGDKAQPLSALWRSKQLEYTWLRSLSGRFVGFWQVTGDALDFALNSLGIEHAGLRERLMRIYFELDAFPEVADTLKTLKRRGMRTAILSNGSTDMLNAAVARAGIADLVDAVLSVDRVQIYKPHPSVYQMAVDWLGRPAEAVCFLSSNGWDAYAAAAFGFRVVWVNRYGQAPERLPGAPVATVSTLAELPPLLGL